MSHADLLFRRRVRRTLAEPGDLARTLDAATYTAARRYVLSTEVPVPAGATTQNRLPLPSQYVIDGIDVRPDEEGCPPDFPMCADTHSRGNRTPLRPEGLGEFAVDLRVRAPPQSLPYHTDLRSKARCPGATDLCGNP